jgi:hypothetical protein
MKLRSCSGAGRLSVFSSAHAKLNWAEQHVEHLDATTLPAGCVPSLFSTANMDIGIAVITPRGRADCSSRVKDLAGNAR